MNMGLDMFSIEIRWSNIRIVAGIEIMTLFLLAGSASADLPPANAAVGDLILDTEIFWDQSQFGAQKIDQKYPVTLVK
jgi:hypothetical protein